MSENHQNERPQGLECGPFDPQCTSYRSNTASVTNIRKLFLPAIGRIPYSVDIFNRHRWKIVHQTLPGYQIVQRLPDEFAGMWAPSWELASYTVLSVTYFGRSETLYAWLCHVSFVAAAKRTFCWSIRNICIRRLPYFKEPLMFCSVFCMQMQTRSWQVDFKSQGCGFESQYGPEFLILYFVAFVNRGNDHLKEKWRRY